MADQNDFGQFQSVMFVMGRNVTVPENGSSPRTNMSPPPYPPFPRNGPPASILMDIIYVLDEFGVPSILTIGIISNLLVTITIRNSELKKVSTCCYFFSLGIVDMLYLIAMSIPWISVRVVDIYNTEGFCQLVYYTNLLTTFLASWYVVMLLSERMLVLYRPDTSDKYCSAFRTKCYITTFSIFSIVGHLYLTWTSGVFIFPITGPMCTVIPENAKDIVIVRKIDVVFSFILPITLSILFMLAIAIFLCTYYSSCKDGALTVETKRLTFELRINAAKRTKHKVSTITTNLVTPAQGQKFRLRMFNHSKRVTAVSFILSLIYVSFFIPHNIIKSRVTFTGAGGMSQDDVLLLRLFEELFKINFAYKGLLYFTMFPEMRKNLLDVLLTCFRRGLCRGKEEKDENGTTV